MSSIPSYSVRLRISWALAGTRQVAAGIPSVWGRTWNTMYRFRERYPWRRSAARARECAALYARSKRLSSASEEFAASRSRARRSEPARQPRLSWAAPGSGSQLRRGVPSQARSSSDPKTMRCGSSATRAAKESGTARLDRHSFGVRSVTSIERSSSVSAGASAAYSSS